MAGELEIGQIFANALALPKTIQAQQQEAMLYRALAQNAAGAGLLLNPEQVNQFAPLPALGQPGSFSARVIANPVFQTVGTVGQLLQGILGAPPSAPRPPLTQLVQLNLLAQRNKFGSQDFKAYQQQHPGATIEDYKRFLANLRQESLRDPKPSLYGDIDAKAQELVKAGKLKPEDVLEWKENEVARVAGKRVEATQQYKDLPVDVRQDLSKIDVAKNTLDRLMGLIENDPDVRAGRGVGEGRIENYLYQIGFTQEDPTDRFLAFTAQVNIVGALPFMKNVRRYEYLLDIRRHLPQPGDEARLIQNKIKAWRQLAIDMKKAGLTYANALRKDIPTMMHDVEEEERGMNAPPSQGAPSQEEIDAAKQRLRGKGYQIP